MDVTVVPFQYSIPSLNIAILFPYLLSSMMKESFRVLNSCCTF